MTTTEEASFAVVLLVFVVALYRLAAYLIDGRLDRCCDCGRPGGPDRVLRVIPDWTRGGSCLVCDACDPPASSPRDVDGDDVPDILMIDGDHVRPPRAPLYGHDGPVTVRASDVDDAPDAISPSEHPIRRDER